MENFEPVGFRFKHPSDGREMLFVEEGEWAGWLCYRHPDGQWVSERKATQQEITSINFRKLFLDSKPIPPDVKVRMRRDRANAEAKFYDD